MFGQVSAPPLRKIRKLEFYPKKIVNLRRSICSIKLTLLLQQLHCFRFVGVGLVVEFVELGVEQLAVELVVEQVVGVLDSELEL